LISRFLIWFRAKPIVVALNIQLLQHMRNPKQSC
jgi:hypothetical protein